MINLKKWQKFKNTGFPEHDFLETVTTIEDIAYSKAEIKMCDFPFDKYSVNTSNAYESG